MDILDEPAQPAGRPSSSSRTTRTSRNTPRRIVRSRTARSPRTWQRRVRQVNLVESIGAGRARHGVPQGPCRHHDRRHRPGRRVGRDGARADAGRRAADADFWDELGGLREIRITNKRIDRIYDDGGREGLRAADLPGRAGHQRRVPERRLRGPGDRALPDRDLRRQDLPDEGARHERPTIRTPTRCRSPRGAFITTRTARPTRTSS